MVTPGAIATLLVFVGALTSLSILRWAWLTRRADEHAEMTRRAGGLVEDGRVGRLLAAETPPHGLGRIGAHLAATLRRGGDDRGVARFLLRACVAGGVGLFATAWILSGPAKLVGLVAALVPYVVALQAANRRSAQISQQLPDALDLVVRTLRAGHGLSDALRITAREMAPPLGDEFAQVAEEHRLGIEQRRALSNMVVRNPDNFDLRLMVSSVLLERETGGNLVELLTHLADTIRERIVFEGKVEALTAEVRFSAVILGLLPFLVAGFIILLRPGYLVPLVATALGRSMLIAGLASMLVGGVLMNHLSRVETA